MTIFYIPYPTQYLNLTATLLTINKQQIRILLRQDENWTLKTPLCLPQGTTTPAWGNAPLYPTEGTRCSVRGGDSPSPPLPAYTSLFTGLLSSEGPPGPPGGTSTRPPAKPRHPTLNPMFLTPENQATGHPAGDLPLVTPYRLSKNEVWPKCLAWIIFSQFDFKVTLYFKVKFSLLTMTFPLINFYFSAY